VNKPDGISEFDSHRKRVYLCP